MSVSCILSRIWFLYLQEVLGAVSCSFYFSTLLNSLRSESTCPNTRELTWRLRAAVAAGSYKMQAERAQTLLVSGELGKWQVARQPRHGLQAQIPRKKRTRSKEAEKAKPPKWQFGPLGLRAFQTRAGCWDPWRRGRSQEDPPPSSLSPDLLCPHSCTVLPQPLAASFNDCTKPPPSGSSGS